jgi:hypothetical protein
MGGSLILSKTGKVALLPGDQVQLQAAPAVQNPGAPSGTVNNAEPAVRPMGLGDTGVFKEVGIGTGTLTFARLSLSDGSAPEASAAGLPWANTIGVYGDGKAYFMGRDVTNNIEYAMGVSILGGAFIGTMTAHDLWFRTDNVSRVTIKKTTGNVGIGTTSPAKKLDVVGDAAVSGSLGVGTTNATARLTVQGTSGDLIAAYNSSNRVFAVSSTGEVRADGAVYAASFNTGSADVAERINTSEWVEAGDVVEIDPDHTGFFRKSADPYSRRVAGIISTSPGVILGNSTDSETGDWDDNRPVLAITGRVPVKVTTENGPIQVGDLLVASSAPGVAMRGDPAAAVGCVVGKAMEPFAEGEGVVVAQVMLR